MATQTMDPKTVAMVREWLDARGGDIEATAKYMARTLRIGSLPSCRDLVRASLAEETPEPVQAFLTIDERGMLVMQRPGMADVTIDCTSRETALASFDGVDDALSSSSLDFPEEYTTDPNVIAICRAIRGVEA